MMRSLWTAATGMHAQQFNIDTISNNLSNVNTNGYKQVRAEFEDLIYLNSRIAGTPATERTVTPTGIQVGHGVRVGASQRMFSQGSLKQTDAIGDMAVMGEAALWATPGTVLSRLTPTVSLSVPTATG